MIPHVGSITRGMHAGTSRFERWGQEGGLFRSDRTRLLLLGRALLRNLFELLLADLANYRPLIRFRSFMSSG